MNRSLISIAAAAMTVCAFTACGGTDATTDTDASLADVIIPVDTNGIDLNAYDIPGRTDTNTGTDNNGGVDTNGGNDSNGGQDTNGGNDSNIGTDENERQDESGVDTNIGTDSGTDTTVNPECSGACDPATETTRCLTGNALICYCNPENSTWTQFDCGDVCDANFMVGDTCGQTEQGDNCLCEFDCSQPTLVSGQCEDLAYTPCTCAASDPCSWKDDGVCDVACADNFPDDHFTEGSDCTCEGACSADQFGAYCKDGAACNCDGETGEQFLMDCTEFCTVVGGIPAEEACSVDQQYGAYCNCTDFSCSDSGKVQNQCDYYGYTECTCAAADPCGWATDTEYCDTPSCEDMFPSIPTFDDTSTAPCQQ